MRKLLICFATVIAAGTLFELGRHQPISMKTRKAEFERAIPPFYSLNSRSKTCVEPNERQRALVKTAVDALAFSSEESGFLSIGAHKLLAHGLYRRDGDRQRVCDIPEQMDRASDLIRSSDHLRRGRIVEYGLRLIAKLPNPGEDLAKVAAESAFNSSPQPSEIFPERDIRPLARATLASLGPLARPYTDQAYAQISMDDSMGTGAAQVAVAAVTRTLCSSLKD